MYKYPVGGIRYYGKMVPTSDRIWWTIMGGGLGLMT